MSELFAAIAASDEWQTMLDILPDLPFATWESFYATVLTTVLARRLGFSKEDEITIVFCGSKKSLATGVPMAKVLFATSAVGPMVLPLMLFHQIQLIACAMLARHYGERAAAESEGP